MGGTNFILSLISFLVKLYLVVILSFHGQDAANKKGGKWVITFKSTQARATPIFDAVWARCLMGIVGERISANGAVTGMVASRRKLGWVPDPYIHASVRTFLIIPPEGDRISVWTRDVTARAINIQVGQMIVVLLDEFSSDVQMDYMHHDESLQAGLSFGVKSHLTKHDLQRSGAA